MTEQDQKAAYDDVRNPKRHFDLVDSALFGEVVFGGFVTVTLWLVLWAVYGIAAFILAVLVAFGAAMWATGLSLYVMKRRDH